jgi:SAM-dependent methyltransferase
MVPRLARIPRAVRDRYCEWADRALDRRYGIDTCGVEDDLAALGIPVPSRGQAKGHEPVQLAVFARVLQALAPPPAQRTFIDLGSGKGRAVILAAQAGFRRSIGVELSPRLHALAAANAERFKSRSPKSAPIELQCGDAAAFAPPPDDMVLFLYNPFGAELLGQVLDTMAASLQRQPRALTIVYRNAVHCDVLRARPQLRCVHTDKAFEIHEWRGAEATP